ncbi:MAG: NAD-binding protein, partial [Thauera sp.]
PRRLVVLGGGPIGCELAQACARLGSQVVLVGRAPQLLPREDADVAAFARAALEADGVEVLTGVVALRCELEQADDGARKFLVVADPASGSERRIGLVGTEHLGERIDDPLRMVRGEAARALRRGLRRQLGQPRVK